MAKNRIVFLTVTWLLGSVCAHAYEIHKQMTLEEVRSTFHVDGHDLVPEYVIVPIHHVKKRTIISTHKTNTLENSIHQKDINTAKLNNSLNSKTLSKPDATTRIPIEDTQNTEKDNKNVPKNDKNTEFQTTHEFEESDLKELRLKAFGDHFNLSLVPQEGLFKKGKLKVYTVEPNATSQHGVEYTEHPETTEDIGQVYQDEKNQAAILLREENGVIIVEGSIGPHLVIRPIPERLRGSVIARKNPARNATDDELFLDQDGDLSSDVAIDTGMPIRRFDGDIELEDGKVATAHHHIVYKRKKAQDVEDAMSDYAFMEPDHISKRYKRDTSFFEKEKNKRKKREAPYTIYPEILVIVDYDGYRLHGGDNVQIKRYFVSFWNGVDMRYKLLKGPKIRVSIAGIIISRGRDATPYLERNRVGRDAIDSAAALTDMGKYLFRERRLPVYDIAVAITKYDMCRRRKGGRCTKGTAGFAYVGGACVVNKRLEKVNSVAIIEDTGGFSGIIVAAHEVGHLLGAVHDGSPPPSYLGGPGAEKCQWTDGFIMSDLRHTERGFRWSPCTVASFHHFLNGDTATCLYNAPHEDDSLPRVLPGKLLTLDAQCRRDRGTSACFKDDRVCAQLFCFDSGSGYCVAYRPAAEGSQCGDGQYCINGRCVAEHENIIPDYSQNSPSYVRANGNPGRPLFYDDSDDALRDKNLHFFEELADPYAKPKKSNTKHSTSAPQINNFDPLPPSVVTYRQNENINTQNNYNNFGVNQPQINGYNNNNNQAPQFDFNNNNNGFNVQSESPIIEHQIEQLQPQISVQTHNNNKDNSVSINAYGFNFNNNPVTESSPVIRSQGIIDANNQQNTQSFNNGDVVVQQIYYSNANEQTSTPHPSTSTKSNFRWGWFTISTTKSPYDFRDFGKPKSTTTTTTSQPLQYLYSPSQPQYLDFFSTRSPYDFGDFGKNYQDNISNNYLKRSYNVASYFGESVRNETVVASGVS